MSRSRKRYPCNKDGKRRNKAAKQTANRKIRRSTRWKWADIPNGGFYRQIYCSYDIYDYRTVWTFRESIEFHQSKYDKCAAKYGVEVAERRYSKDWLELYRQWARFYLWK